MGTFQRVVSFGAWTALGLGGAIGCGSDEPAKTVDIKLGAVIDQSSTTAWTSWTLAGNLAISQLNATLAKSGSNLRFQLVVRDTQQDGSVAIAAARELVASGAKTIITDTSSNGIGITKLMYNESTDDDINVPVICVTCTAPALNDPAASSSDAIQQATLRDEQGWNFRTVHRGTEQTMILKNVIASQGNNGDTNSDNVFKVTVVALNDASGHGYVQSVHQLFADVPGTVIVEKVVISGANQDVNDTAFWDALAATITDNDTTCPQDPDTTDGCLAAVADDGIPDALMENLNPGYNIALSEALARASSTVPFYHAHAFRAPQIAQILRSAINGQWGVSGVLQDASPSGGRFAQDLEAATGSGPSLLDNSMYDAVVLSALAVLKAGAYPGDASAATGAEVRTALEQLNDKAGPTVRVGTQEFQKALDHIKDGTSFDYEGASGPIDFDAYGNVAMRMSLYQGEGGAFVDRKIFDCVASLSTCPEMN